MLKRKKNTVCFHLYVECKNKANDLILKKTDTETELVVTSGDRGRGKRQIGKGD